MVLLQHHTLLFFVSKQSSHGASGAKAKHELCWGVVCGNVSELPSWASGSRECASSQGAESVHPLRPVLMPS